MKPKTYKRETAWVMLLWVIGMSLWSTPQILSIIIVPAFMFIGAAFGMEWASKQTDLVGNGKKG